MAETKKLFSQKGLVVRLARRFMMKTFKYEGYYDGKTIITDARLEKDQKVGIVPVKSPAGTLHKYADVSKIPMEKEAFANAMVKKHS